VGGWHHTLANLSLADPVPAAQRIMGLRTSLDRQRKSLPQCDLIPGPFRS